MFGLIVQLEERAACEVCGLAGLRIKCVVPSLVATHLHDLG
jgi:hypothetical protein